MRTILFSSYKYEPVFPEKLSDEETNRLINELRNGNTSVRNILIVHNLRLVAQIARKYYNISVDLGDLISIGTIGLIKGINGFNPEKNVKLATYISRCIENELLLFYRKCKKQLNEINLEDVITYDWDGNEMILGSVLGTDGTEITINMDKLSDKNIVHEAINILSDMEKSIITLRYDENKTQQEVAKVLNIHQTYVSRLEKRAYDKMRKYINKCLVN